MNEDLTYLRTLDPDAFEDMPSRRLEALRPLLGRTIETIQLNTENILREHQSVADLPPRRERLLHYIGDTLLTVSDRGGVRVSVSEPLQSLTLHPPAPLLPAGEIVDDLFPVELIDVAEFADWRPLLGRRIEGIDIIIGDYAPEKFGDGVLERGLQFRLQSGLSFIAAVWSEASALWLPGEAPERWRREIHSITPIA